MRPERGQSTAAGTPVAASADHETGIILASISELVAYYDLDFRIIRANEAAARSVGLTEQQMVGRRCFELWHQRSEPCEGCPVVETLATGEPRAHQVSTPDGRTFDLRSYPVHNPAGELIGAVEIGLDITAKQRAEAALRDTQERLRLALEAVSDGVWDWRVGPAEYERSAQWYALTGYTPDELRAWEEAHGSIIALEDRERVHRAIQDHLDGKTDAYRAEFRVRHKSGAWRWILGRGRVVSRDEQGHPLRMIGTDTDITSRKLAEEALRSSEERYRTLAENFPNGALFLFDRDIRYIFVGGHALEVAGLTREEIIGRTVFEVFPPEVHEIAGPGCRAAFEGRSSHYEVRFRGRLYENHVVPVVRPGEPITEGIAITQDITERRQLEEQIHQSRKLEAIGQLAGGVAHDFNNILTAILGNVELLRLTMADEFASTHPVHDGLDQIEQSGQRAAALTRQLLMFSRRQLAKPELLDLNTVLSEMHKMLERLVPESVMIAPHYADGLWPIRGDVAQLEQVVMNLVVNARDAMPDGGRIELATANVTLDEDYVARQADAQPGPHVRLTVRDTGCGISEDVLPRMFEPFFSTKPSGEGTGLGLATVHGVVRQAGGHVQVDSKPGAGATFTVCWPACLDEARESAADKPVGSVPGGTETVLVCEDDQAVRQLTCRALRGHGYIVLEAAGARHALEIVETYAGAIHMLVTDVIMPGMDGRQLAESIARRKPDMRVLYVSGYSHDVIGQRGLVDDGVELLPKPFSSGDLLRRVRSVLDA